MLGIVTVPDPRTFLRASESLFGFSGATGTWLAKYTANLLKEQHMADETKGKAKHVGGKITEKVGEFLGDNQLANQGRLSQVEGEAEQDQARAEDAVVDAAARKRAAQAAKDLNRKP